MYKNIFRTERIIGALECRYSFREFEAAGIHYKQTPVLLALISLGESTQADIARFLYVSRASIGVSIKRLEKDGFVTKNHKPEDGRCNTVSLTKKGYDIATQSRKLIDKCTIEKFKGFSEQDLLKYLELLKKIEYNLKEINSIIPD